MTPETESNKPDGEQPAPRRETRCAIAGEYLCLSSAIIPLANISHITSGPGEQFVVILKNGVHLTYKAENWITWRELLAEFLCQ